MLNYPSGSSFRVFAAETMPRPVNSAGNHRAIVHDSAGIDESGRDNFDEVSTHADNLTMPFISGCLGNSLQFGRPPDFALC